MRAVYLPGEVIVSPAQHGRCICGKQAKWLWDGEKICSRCFLEVKLAAQKEEIDFIMKFNLVMRGGSDRRIYADGSLTDDGCDQLATVIYMTNEKIRKSVS
jgi:hypothetical protein